MLVQIFFFVGIYRDSAFPFFLLHSHYPTVQSQLVKLQKALKPEEFAAAMVNVTNRFDFSFFSLY